MTTTTFAELGIPFPLFEALTSEASHYVGLASCRLCEKSRQHCFKLDIGCRVILPCPACGVENGLDTRDRQDGPCRNCQSSVPFPATLKDEQDIRICYACLRAGKGAMTTDTEFGMVSWEQAIQGVTHGVPGLQTDEFERVLISEEEDWYGVRVPQEHLLELVRTPGYGSWQGECWLFCCKRPMTYIGEWASVLSSQFPEADPRAVFDRVSTPEDESKEWVWERLSVRKWDAICLYIFQCKQCNRFKSTWDLD
jgi:uncharacterized protein CbrC (UPF0167 family)